MQHPSYNNQVCLTYTYLHLDWALKIERAHLAFVLGQEAGLYEIKGEVYKGPLPAICPGLLSLIPGPVDLMEHICEITVL
jgi:hypothetical protein